ncbi:MAG: hypothetical protein RPR97_08990, partial [Colwellia sp.]
MSRYNSDFQGGFGLYKRGRSILASTLFAFTFFIAPTVNAELTNRYCHDIPFKGDHCHESSYTYTNEEINSFISENYYVDWINSEKALYQGGAGREDIESFDGMNYFLDKIKKENFDAFPDATLVPIAGEITIFVPFTGLLPKNLGTPYIENQIIREQVGGFIEGNWILGYASPSA